MVWVASGIQTARIRHGDKGSLCRRMSNALTDESETLLSLFLSVFSCSSLLSFLSIYSPPRSAFPLLLSLSFRGCHSIFSLSALLLPPVTPFFLFLAVRCSFTLHFSLSSYFLSHFTHIFVCVNPCMYLQFPSNSVLAWAELQYYIQYYKLYMISITNCTRWGRN